MISVWDRDATTHGRLPIMTVASSARCSKLLPLKVRSVPPPAEPALGEIAVIATHDSNVSVLGTAASPNVGKWTRTG